MAAPLTPKATDTSPSTAGLATPSSSTMSLSHTERTIPAAGRRAAVPSRQMAARTTCWFPRGPTSLLLMGLGPFSSTGKLEILGVHLISFSIGTERDQFCTITNSIGPRSVRTQKRVGGSVNMQAHFNAWASHGLRLGQHYYQIVATEGYQSSGNSEIYVQTK
jgi:hypothetical protein